MGGLDLDLCISKLSNKQLLDPRVVKLICDQLTEILVCESNIQYLSTPITVVGDVHGQLNDMLEIFQIGGPCPDTNYLFLGDYVDRGYYSVETISILACLKLRYPNRITLIRGNHESRAVTQTYGFYTECLRKYGNADVWRYFTDMFDYLTLSAVIDDVIFCVHGGLSPSIHTLDQIRVIDRFKEIPHDGPMLASTGSLTTTSYLQFMLLLCYVGPISYGLTQKKRGAGYTFGQDIVEKFLYLNNCRHILRAHQLCHEGYSVIFDDLVTTVWSAPNYCYRCGNMASILEISPSLDRFFNVFEAAPGQDRDIHSLEPDASSFNTPDYFL